MDHRKQSLLLKTEALVKEHLSSEASGHDWWHVVRVRHTAKEIAIREGADSFICQMAALLHDMIDDKLQADPELAKQQLHDWMLTIGLSLDETNQIETIIDTISFKGGHGSELTSLEAKVVQDADRLDALGAIGIARCMAYSGHKGRLIHDPNRLPRKQMSFEDYRNGKDTAIMHFYEKLLKLKDLMTTDYGKEMDQKRHDFLITYLEEFYAEWEGKR
ncbi:HD domain-containing protein [Streptococcus ictaluri]|uniref:HD domain protein n=1 Tax=Streptococcus ictaluri 707-05 TaxID=764299 RepID=G5K2K3_9STRE|nr:HD domain-containing protein [Streptococcus ictaluri]EHI69407.1 HD domain protein [Streptococcus ictaluri 707-05]